MSQGDRPPLGFARFRRRATRMLDDRSRIRALGEQAVDRIDLRGSRLGDALDDLDALRRLMNAWVRAEYREVPRSTIVLVVAAVLYFVVPTDLIPDFIVAVGFVDDVAVIGWVTRELRRELSSFRDWEQRQDAMETFIGRSPLRDD